jgi:hypothetical protein
MRGPCRQRYSHQSSPFKCESVCPIMLTFSAPQSPELILRLVAGQVMKSALREGLQQDCARAAPEPACTRFERPDCRSRSRDQRCRWREECDEGPWWSHLHRPGQPRNARITIHFPTLGKGICEMSTNQEPCRTAAAVECRSATARLRLLLVDDEPVLRETASAVLSEQSPIKSF